MVGDVQPKEARPFQSLMSISALVRLRHSGVLCGEVVATDRTWPGPLDGWKYTEDSVEKGLRLFQCTVVAKRSPPHPLQHAERPLHASAEQKALAYAAENTPDDESWELPTGPVTQEEQR